MKRLLCCDCSQPVLARCDIAEIGDGLPLSMEERSCSGHHCNEQPPGRVLRMELRSGERQLRRRDVLSYCR